jgi:hypothetical protein
LDIGFSLAYLRDKSNNGIIQQIRPGDPFHGYGFVAEAEVELSGTSLIVSCNRGSHSEALRDLRTEVIVYG